MLRIVGGKYKRSLLEQPDFKNTRATTDRVRESIFNCLQEDINKSIVLDLFSGSGAMAIESISRGAMKAICVDNSQEAISIIKNNVQKLSIHNIDIYKQDAIEFLNSKKGTKYDLIFLDPPYKNISLLNQCLELLAKENYLNTYGKIIIETKNEYFSEIIVPKKMISHQVKKYGKTTIFFINNIL